MVGAEFLFQLCFLSGIEPGRIVVYVNSGFRFGREHAVLCPQNGNRDCHRKQKQQKKLLTHK